jgi:hypothetical protein
MVDFSTIGRRVATQVVNNGFQKVAGNIKGTIFGGKKGSDSSDTNSLNRNQVDVKTHQFPLDVMSDPGLGNHGHYIMFFINAQEGSKLAFGTNIAKAGDKHFQKVKENRNAEPISVLMKKNEKTGQSERKKVTRDDKQFFDSGVQAFNSKSIFNTMNPNTVKPLEGAPVVSTKRNATHRLDTAIAMYMPQALNVTYGARYVDTEISPLGAMVGGAAGGIMDGSITNVTEFVETVGKKIPDEIKRRLGLAGLAAADLIGATGAREAFEIDTGEVITQRMELAFKNINRRAFTYNFKMIPKNEKEAEEIQKIIYAFKFNMLPEMTGGRTGITMNFPNTFDIEYKFLQKENDYLHRVSTCVLETMSVTYGGDRFKTFAPTSKGAPVVETTINLAFKELELITSERVEEGD